MTDEHGQVAAERTGPVAAPLPRTPASLDPALAVLFGEIVELKRVRSPGTGGRSLADVGFRRAWAALAAGMDADAVGAAEVAFAAAHVALGPVDAAALAGAGVAAADRRAIYRRAAARWLGPLEDAAAAGLDRIADGAAPDGPLPPAVAALSAAVRPDRPKEDETLSEHSFATAVLAGIVARARGEAPGGGVLLSLAHHLDGVPDGLGAALSRRIARVAADRNDVAAAAGYAFQVGHVVDRTLQGRHYANLAGFSLSDAVDPRAFADAGPLHRFHSEVLARLGFVF